MNLHRFTAIVGLISYTQMNPTEIDPGRPFILECWNNSLLKCKGLPAVLMSIRESLSPEELDKVNEVLKKKLQIDLDNPHSVESLRGVLRPSRFIRILAEVCFPFIETS